VPCQGVSVPGGGTAIVCGTRRRQRCACGQPSTLVCDWKVTAKKSGTCDAPICSKCSTSPAPDKDLCPKHAAESEPYFSKAMRGVDLLDDQAVGKVARKFQVSLGAVHYRIALAERLIRPIAMRAGRS
jgi:hypothetical protein